MPLETQLAELFSVIEGGKAVEAGSIVQFPVDAGATALEGVTETVELGNGIATEVSQLTAVEGGASTTAGVGIMAVDVGVAGAAIAPALGILAGVGLYELAPDFWQSVADALIEAGETIGGKVQCFINSADETFGFTERTIEIFKNAFIQAGVFDGEIEVIDLPDNITTINYLGTNFSFSPSTYNAITKLYDYVSYTNSNIHGIVDIVTKIGYMYGSSSEIQVSAPKAHIGVEVVGNQLSVIATWDMTDIIPDYTGGRGVYYLYGSTGNLISAGGFSEQTSIYNNVRKYLFTYNFYVSSETFPDLYNFYLPYVGNMSAALRSALDLYSIITTYENVQDGATIPNSNPFPQTYPNWTPYTLPDEQTKVYPLTMPAQNPNPTQQPAQNPDPVTDPSYDPQSILDFLLDNFPLPTPGIQPQPVPEPDPDPQPQPDPIEDPTKPETDPNPVDPNPSPDTPVLPVVPDLPATVPANAMFTVYAPSITQVNSFGGWLWDNNIIEQIKRIWNNPLEGIISFMKVYAVPQTSGSDTIKVGVLDSGVTSAVVSNQFVTVNCGTINIREKFYNATDYSPFVALHLYLPFIGIVELDCDEFMNGSITVDYHIDIYTGTCLAEVKATRSYDMPNATIVYTFSGNASQRLPLTSAEFSGAISALVGVVGGGLAIATGGGLGLLAGASGIAHAVTHEMVHIAHSGSLSANAGIMGARKPFLILTRRRSYDANGYNQLYGYPSNKTVYINNCSGLIRVKDIQLKTSATRSEKDEIDGLLRSGVIV